MLFTFEGTDGSGKTTIINTVASELRTYSDYNVIVTCEPTDKTVLRGGKYEVLYKLLADRAAHAYQMLEWLKKPNTIVLCDRYIDSTVVYQGYYQNLAGLNVLRALNAYAIGNLIPNKTFWIDVDIDECLARIEKRGDDKHLTRDTLNTLYNGYRMEFYANSRRIERVKNMDVDKACANVERSIKRCLRYHQAKK